MKMLVRREPISPATPFQFADLKLFARVDHSEEDSVIFNMGMTAAAEIEEYAQIALLTQKVRVTIFDPDCGQYGLHLPIGPVAMDAQPTVTIDSQPFTAFDFLGGNRPYIRWLAPYHDLQPSRILIEYDAGFGSTASAIPADLAQVIKDHTMFLYEARGPIDAKVPVRSPHFARIGARYRGVSA